MIEVQASDLSDGIRRVRHALPKKGLTNWPVLNHVQLTASQDSLRLVAADNFRLAIVALPVQAEPSTFLLHRELLPTLLEWLKLADGHILLTPGEDLLLQSVEVPGVVPRHALRLPLETQAAYPDWETQLGQPEGSLSALLDSRYLEGISKGYGGTIQLRVPPQGQHRPVWAEALDGSYREAIMPQRGAGEALNREPRV